MPYGEYGKTCEILKASINRNDMPPRVRNLWGQLFFELNVRSFTYCRAIFLKLNKNKNALNRERFY